jgi:hypothetical protein
MIFGVMIFAVVVWLNNAPSLAAAHHRTSPRITAHHPAVLA